MPLKFITACLLTLLPFSLLAKDIEGYLTPATVKNLYEELVFERVVDGDTFYASGRKIRLWGIDVPERGEPLYEISTKALELFLKDALLSCKIIDVDRYKRDVMHCHSNGADVGAFMVKAGFAKDYTKYSGGFYKQEEAFAKHNKLGVWK